LAAFSARTGLELGNTAAALIAGYDLGTVYGVTTERPVADAALAAFRARLRDGGRLTRVHPRLQRVSGLSGETPEALVTAGERVALVTVGDLTLARVIEAFALGRLERSPSALRGVSLSRLPAASAEAIAVLYVPGPFVGEWSHGAAGLLGTTEALSLSLVPAGSGRARFHLTMVGAFPADAGERLSSTWSNIAASTTGRLLGLDRPLAPPLQRSTPERVELEIQLEITPIADSLRTVISGEAWEILNLPAPTLP
jgi:hypothetical protein